MFKVLETGEKYFGQFTLDRGEVLKTIGREACRVRFNPPKSALVQRNHFIDGVASVLRKSPSASEIVAIRESGARVAILPKPGETANGVRKIQLLPRLKLSGSEVECLLRSKTTVVAFMYPDNVIEFSYDSPGARVLVEVKRDLKRNIGMTCARSWFSHFQNFRFEY